MKTQVRTGDVVEIVTAKGLAYAQFTHYHSNPPNFGALLRILPGFFRVRPLDFKPIVQKETVFSTFFPLQAAVNRKLVAVVAHETVPPHAQQFPIFRNGTPNPSTGTVEQWWLWDGTKEWKVGKLTDEQLDFPLLLIPSYPTLIEKIESGWTPRRFEEFIAKARAKAAAEGKRLGGPKKVEELRHYLIFEEEQSARRALESIVKAGLRAGITDLGERWGVNILQPDLSDEAVEKVRVQLEDIASIHKGIYDGTQVKLTDAE